MERIELSTLGHTVERTWIAYVQGRQPTIRVGRLADGRWWWGRSDGQRDQGAWACDTELAAEQAAHRWSERSELRWRLVTTASKTDG